jgi:multiple sugar transport system permease protein
MVARAGQTRLRSDRPDVSTTFMGRSHSFWRRTLAGYTFITPNLIALLVFTLGPVVAGLVLSFTSWDLLTKPVFVGLANYKQLLFKDEFFWNSLKNTIYYSLLTVPVGIVVSLALALVLNRHMFGVRIYRTLFFIPVVSSSVAVALVWKWLYNTDFGVLNWLLELVGLHGQPWLTSSRWAMLAVALTVIWKTMGYNMVIFLAGLQEVPQSLYEAASVDGAGSWARLRYITLPLLVPQIFFVLVMSVISSFQAFDMVYVMTGGGPGNATQVYNYYIWQNAFQWFKMGYASALGYVLFVLIFGITLIQVRYMGRRVYTEVA